VTGLPPSLSPLSQTGCFRSAEILILGRDICAVFSALFDSIGTLIGIGRQGGFLVEGRLPRAKQALFSDAFSTVVGTSLGTSTGDRYIESASGVAPGRKNRFSQFVHRGVLFLIALFSIL